MKKKILIVEDEPILLKALQDKLIKEGFDVISAKNGEDGLIMALEQHPDIILLDIVMPKMDGMSMLSKLREDEFGKQVRVIFLTNLNDDKKMTESKEKGVDHYLVKSNSTLADLVAILKR